MKLAEIMSQQSQRLAARQAEQSRFQGIATAAAHAESVKAQWQDEALTMLRFFLRRHRDSFTSEQLVTWSAAKGFSSPTDDRSWGAVILRAKREGLIKRAGYGYSAKRFVPVPSWLRA